MDQWEYLRASLLEIKIKNIGLTTTESSQLHKILDLQFQEDCCTEIGGSIFNKKTGDSQLEFEVIHPPEHLEVENALKSFQQRDFSKISLLADYISRARKSIELYHGENLDLTTAAVIFDVAAKNPTSLTTFDEKKIQLYVDFYKYFLGSYTGAFGKDLKVDKEGFLAIFHCHNDGSKPSPMDIQANIKSGVPDLVISAKQNYIELGATLYLVSGGKFERLYQGSLQL